MRLLQLQEYTEGTTCQVEIVGVEDEAVFRVIKSGLGHVRQLRNMCGLV